MFCWIFVIDFCLIATIIDGVFNYEFTDNDVMLTNKHPPLKVYEELVVRANVSRGGYNRRPVNRKTQHSRLEKLFRTNLHYCDAKKWTNSLMSCFNCVCYKSMAYTCTLRNDYKCARFRGLSKGFTFRAPPLGCVLCRCQSSSVSICVHMKKCIRKPVGKQLMHDKFLMDELLPYLNKVEGSNSDGVHSENGDNLSIARCNKSQILHNRHPYEGRCMFAVCWKNEWLVRVSDRDCPAYPITNAWCEDPKSNNKIIILHYNCFTCSCMPDTNLMVCQKNIVGANWDEGSTCRTTVNTILNPDELLSIVDVRRLNLHNTKKTKKIVDHAIRIF